MKTYRGARLGDKCTVRVHDDCKGTIRDVQPHTAALLASVERLFEAEQTTTFDWGNSSRGAYILAMALLLDATQDVNASQDLVQAFLQQYIATWGATWAITDGDIFAWTAGGAPQWAPWQG